MRFLFVFLGISLFASVWGMRRRYDGYQVWKVGSTDHAQREKLAELENEGLIDQVGNEVMVSPGIIPKVSSRLQESHIHHSIETVNIQREVDTLQSHLGKKHHYDKHDFNTYKEIIQELLRLREENCPSTFTCSVYSIGKSYEGRHLVVFKISKGTGRPALWFDSLIHAREWLAGTTLMRVLDQFLVGYEEDPDARYVLDKYDIYFLPVQNPDGYAYTWSTERFWRKNRRPNEGSDCVGVDLNRNFDWKWGVQPGASNDPCSPVYFGPSVASESETRAVKAEVLSHINEIIVFTTIHTTARKWLTSFGDCTTPPNNDEIMRISNATIAAIEKTYSTSWTAGNACELMYQQSGISADWATSIGIPYSWTPELRGPGFAPHRYTIFLAYREMWNGFIAMVKEIDKIEREKSK